SQGGGLAARAGRSETDFEWEAEIRADDHRETGGRSGHRKLSVGRGDRIDFEIGLAGVADVERGDARASDTGGGEVGMGWDLDLGDTADDVNGCVDVDPGRRRRRQSRR